MSLVLVVDDKEMLRDSVGVTLQRAGHTVLAAAGGEAALETIARRRPDAIVTDLKMPGMTGLELLERIREFDDDLPVVLMTAFGAVETAVEAMRLGAYTYITKPFEGDELVIAVKRAIEHAKLRKDNAVLKLSAGGDSNGSASRDAGGSDIDRRALDRVIGSSPIMRTLKDKLVAVAASQGTVLIQGESGVGKEVVARALHEMSPRSNEAFLAMNCAALSESLLESELFGHEKGAFTGAEKLRKGRFELSDRGTLLLDEVSEVSPRIQAKLLRVLQERAFERVGSSTTILVDVRVIATTNRRIEQEVETGRFRQDLHYRLNVLPVVIPPLRVRVEDVPELAAHFVQRVCEREGRPGKQISDSAMDLLCGYRWPGNVRELQNICERAVVLSEADVIEPDLIRGWVTNSSIAPPRPVEAFVASEEDSFYEPTPGAPTGGFDPSGIGSFDSLSMPTSIVGEQIRPLEEIERQAIIETLERFNGHRQKTAEALGIGVRTLGLKLKKWKEANLVAETL